MKGLEGNGFVPIIAQAIAEMEETHGEFKSIEKWKKHMANSKASMRSIWPS